MIFRIYGVWFIYTRDFFFFFWGNIFYGKGSILILSVPVNDGLHKGYDATKAPSSAFSFRCSLRGYV